MSPLDRTFALAQINAFAEFIGQDLNLDVPGTLNEPLNINSAVLEGRGRLVRSCFQRMAEIFFRTHDPHTAPAAAG